MTHPRLPIGVLMIAVVLVATFCSELRAFLIDNHQRSVGFEFAVCGPPLLVVGNLLLALILLAMPQIWRTGRWTGSFWLGFQVVGWLMLPLVMVAGLVVIQTLTNSTTLDRSLEAFNAFVQPLFAALPKSFPADDLTSFLLPAVVLGGPALVLAVVGGLTCRAFGIECVVEIGRHGTARARA